MINKDNLLSEWISYKDYYLYRNLVLNDAVIAGGILFIEGYDYSCTTYSDGNVQTCSSLEEAKLETDKRLKELGFILIEETNYLSLK